MHLEEVEEKTWGKKDRERPEYLENPAIQSAFEVPTVLTIPLLHVRFLFAVIRLVCRYSILLIPIGDWYVDITAGMDVIYNSSR